MNGENLLFVDGGVFLGRDRKSPVSLDASELVARMDADGVSLSVAGAFAALNNSEDEGNAEVLEAARRYPDRIVPMAVLSALAFRSGQGRMERLARQGFRLVGLFPAYQGWPVGLQCVRELGKEAADAGLAIQVAVSNWEELSGAARAFGGLNTPVLVRWVRGGGYLYPPEEIALGRLWPNLLFDVGNATMTGAIAELCQTLGGQRLFASSNRPLVYERSAYYRVLTEDLTPSDREWVAGRTLLRALGLAAERFQAVAPAADFAGDLTRPKIDVHWHQGSWGLGEQRLRAAEIAGDFDRYGYRYGLISSIRAILSDLRAGNAETAALIEKDKRFLGLVVVSPVDAAASLREIDRYIGSSRFVGLKTAADYYDTTLDDERYGPILSRANDLALPILTHKYGLEAVAANHPRVVFLAAHSQFADVKRLAKFENVFFDLAASYACRNELDLEGMVALVGDERVLYATDAQVISPVWSIGKVSSAMLDQAAKEKIFFGNASRLLRDAASRLGVRLA